MASGLYFYIIAHSCNIFKLTEAIGLVCSPLQHRVEFETSKISDFFKLLPRRT